ncbi:hypothetical protein FG877_00120 [Enterococcus casseliflavus]|nr:hypothetical protein [Enterococcus casseliflavus]
MKKLQIPITIIALILSFIFFYNGIYASAEGTNNSLSIEVSTITFNFKALNFDNQYLTENGNVTIINGTSNDYQYSLEINAVGDGLSVNFNDNEQSKIGVSDKESKEFTATLDPKLYDSTNANKYRIVVKIIEKAIVEPVKDDSVETNSDNIKTNNSKEKESSSDSTSSYDDTSILKDSSTEVSSSSDSVQASSENSTNSSEQEENTTEQSLQHNVSTDDYIENEQTITSE